MKYFDLTTIKQSISRLEKYSANWLLPAFVFAANDVGTEALVDMSKKLGTDQFLDLFFHGNRLNLPPMRRGNNLLRPRMSGITWNRGPFAGDFLIRQDTKMWGNLFSSRGYREMRLEGLIEGERAIAKLTDAFQGRFESEIPESFHFEDFLVWLFAFEGIPDEINSWPELLNYLLNTLLGLKEFKPPYQGRFKLSSPAVTWPNFLAERPSNEQYLKELAPKLFASLSNKGSAKEDQKPTASLESRLSADDPIIVEIHSAIKSGESLTFLFAGPPGTGKTHYARLAAMALAEYDPNRTLFLQFHPAIGYDDFIEGFRPIESSGGQGVRYELASRLFLNFANLAASKQDDLYVAVIDELNRGDVARIFGEVLTYLEVDYRNVSFTLPYSGRTTQLPRNLIVIATANPYDRSVTDMDDALLRRFWVVEFEPDGAMLRAHLEDAGVEKGIVNRTVHAFTILNKAFPNGFGHTNFLGVRFIEDLVAVWNGRVKLALRRAYIHDKATYDATVAEIEELLKQKDSESELGQI